MALSPDELRDLQRGMNAFTNRYLYNVAPLIIDGKRGKHTNDRIRWCKYYLGYLRPRGGMINAAANKAFRERVWHPRSPRYSNPARLALAAQRRIIQRKTAHTEEHHAHHTSGVGTFDGHAVANVAIPLLQWARRNGWKGWLVSGYRTPAYSESLCYRMCGRPSCPGRCAGRATNHAWTIPSRFAVDVSDYVNFGRIIARCPLSPHIHNALRNDRVHFSPSGG
jgi:hypothetical protein